MQGYTEGETVELKASFADLQGIAHAICAFANTRGGSLYLGIDDRGNVVGVKDPEKAQRAIADIFRDMRPMPFHSITVQEKGYYHVLAITVNAFDKEVCFYHGRAWIRSGSTNRLLEGSQLVNFIREKSIISFEDSFAHASMDDIDTGKISEYFSLRSGGMPPLSPTGALTNLRLMDGDKLKNIALLFFARDVKTFFPQCSIKLVKFRGVDPVDILNADFFTGTIIEMINHALSFIRANTATEYEITGTQRIEKAEFPILAYREAVLNAIGHRDYFDGNSIQLCLFDDRMEITNPGKLPEGIRIQDLGKIARHRNPGMYNMLVAAKFVEAVGTGIPRMIAEMRASLLADPVFEEIGGMFRVILYNAKGTRFRSIAEKEKKAFEILRGKNSATASEIAKQLGVSVTSTVTYLKKLESIGYVKKTGATRSSKFFLNV